MCITCPASAACKGFLILDIVLLFKEFQQPLIMFCNHINSILLVSMLIALEAITTDPLGIREFSYGEELALTGTALTRLTPPPQKNAPNSSQHVLACVLHVDRSSYHSSDSLWGIVWVSFAELSWSPFLGREVRIFSSSLSWFYSFPLKTC